MSTENNDQDAMQTDTPAPTQPQDEQAPAASQQTYRQIAASHIEALNKLNSNLPDILALIAAALSQLTNNPIQSEAREDSVQSRNNDTLAFSNAIKAYMQEFRAALIDQINDLERYKVIPAYMPRFNALPRESPGVGGAQSQQSQAPVSRDPDAGVKNGGYGDFDVGVLNARVASGQVGGDDTLDRVKAVLDELLARSGQKTDGEEMVVDG
jgi:hypothetical protein